MKLIRRIIGLIMLLTGVILLVICLAAAFFIPTVLDSVLVGVESALGTTGQGLTAAKDTLLLAQDTVDSVNVAMDSAITTTDDVAQTVADTGPMLDNISTVATEQVPDSLQAIEDTLPAVIEVAGVIDQTLIGLSGFGFEQDLSVPVLGAEIPIPLSFDLGIEYEPEVAFDEALGSLETSIADVPESLRALQTDLDAANQNLTVLSTDLFVVADSLEGINQNIALLNPILDQYIDIIDQINNSLTITLTQLQAQLGTIGLALAALFFFLGLTQLAPIYLGFELLTGQRDLDRLEDRIEEEVAEEMEKAADAYQTPPVVAAESATVITGDSPTIIETDSSN